MKGYVFRSQTSNMLFAFLPDSASLVGAGKGSLDNTSGGLNISVRRQLSAAMTTYTSAASNVEDITTLGTWAAPTASKCRFKAVDNTNAPGLYEIHLADALFGAADASRSLIGYVSATGVAPVPFEIPLGAVDLQNATSMGITRLDQTIGSRATPADVAAQDSQTIRSGTLTGGSTTTANLDAGASATDDFYNNCGIRITHASGHKEFRAITDYNGTTKIATLETGRPLAAAAANAETFEIVVGAPAEITGTVSASMVEINGNAGAAAKLALAADSMAIGTVDDTAFTPTTTEFECSDITEDDANQFVGRTWLVTSGDLIRAQKKITGYSLASGRGHFTTEAFPSAPVDGDTGIVV